MDNLAQFFTELGPELLHELLYILPYLVVGVLFEAIIRTLKWHVKIRHALTKYGLFAIPAATLLGVASPLCACATLPLVISLLVAGLPLAPAMALLVTSPLMSPASFTMLSGMLGVSWAVTVTTCAVLLGMIAGFTTHFLRNKGFSEKDVFRKALPQGDFHDPDYPVEELRCECGKQLSHRVNRCTHNKFLVFLNDRGQVGETFVGGLYFFQHEVFQNIIDGSKEGVAASPYDTAVKTVVRLYQALDGIGFDGHFHLFDLFRVD